MPIFQLHIRDEDGLIPDEDGFELPDALAAAQEAIRSAREFLEEASVPTKMAFEITDEAGRLVLTMPIRSDIARTDEEENALTS